MINQAQTATRFQLEAEMDGPMKGPRKRPTGTRPRGYAWTPGSGPDGETCGSCANIYRRHMGGTYPKCLLMKAHWTRGKSTDIKVRSPACREWKKREPA